MDISMTQKELEEFLSKPILARIATVGKNSAPHIAPVWFMYENGALIISTGRDAAKIKNIKRNPAVAVCIDTTEGGFQSRGVILRGKAELVEKDTLEITKKIYKKYLDNLDNPMAKQLLQMPRTVIKLKPQKIFSWDYSKMMRK
jgi:PPOX class probable F420-dependent enzyme